MPRVLMLAHWFPPCRRWPTAARRAEGFARYLPEFGWDTVVIAPDLDAFGLCDCGADHAAEVDGIEVHRIALPNSPLARFGGMPTTAPANAHANRHAVPSNRVGLGPTLRSLFEVRGTWLRTAHRAARERLALEHFDAVWTTSGPSSSAVVGRWLQREVGLPWVADLRDPISSVIVRPGASALPQRLLRSVSAIPALRRADAVVAASQGSADLDRATLRRDVSTVLSGIEPPTTGSELEGADPAPDEMPDLSGDMTIALMGALYPTAMLADVLVAGLSRHRAAGGGAHLHYFGDSGQVVVELATKYGVEDFVTDHGRVPASWVASILARVTLTALLEYTTGDTRIPGKVYEVAASGTPTLVVPGTNPEVQQILSETTATMSAHDAEGVELALSRLHGQRRTVDPLHFAYTRRAGTAELGRILDRTLDSVIPHA